MAATAAAATTASLDGRARRLIDTKTPPERHARPGLRPARTAEQAQDAGKVPEGR